ncbi:MULTISPECIES: T9SS type A sorting domain-containing protein [Tenacibaculum]|uniref:T9SS type A sorting domain-containing protein n=1 Tax=Tenacibaculum TaxID=104267 RepID=UPI0034A17F5F
MTKSISFKQQKTRVKKSVPYDLLGQKNDFTHKYISTNLETRIKKNNLSKAVYLVNINTNNGSFSRKIIIN